MRACSGRARGGDRTGGGQGPRREDRGEEGYVDRRGGASQRQGQRGDKKRSNILLRSFYTRGADLIMDIRVTDTDQPS